jgi:pimeloyl-ACP methyl ester carboxylesterase
VGADIRTLLTYQLFGVRLAQLHEEFDVDGDGKLTKSEILNGLVAQPEDLVAYYREVRLSGDDVNPVTDADHDGVLAIDDEVGKVLRKKTRIDDYPKSEGLDAALQRYVADIDRFGNVSIDLPRFDGPTLVLNGESDLNTPAGRTDHKLITYPGVGHTMNLTSKFTGGYGEPDAAVLKDVSEWLKAHR